MSAPTLFGSDRDPEPVTLAHALAKLPPLYTPAPKLSGLRPKSGIRADERPFDWRKTVKNPWCLEPGSEARRKAVRSLLAAHVRRMKNHPAAKTWCGEYPDAPEAGNRPGPSLSLHTGERRIRGNGWQAYRCETAACDCPFCQKARAAA